MGKAVLLALVLLMTVAAAASPASAQGAQAATPEPSAPAGDDGSFYRDEYEVTEDGTLIIGGDVSFPCEDVSSFGAPAGASSAGRATLEGETEEYAEVCRAAGFSPDGGMLPETGGLALPGLVLAAGAFGVTGALFALRVRR